MTCRDANYGGATSAPLAFLITATQNLITNGDFELGYNIDWEHRKDDGGNANYSDETTSPYQGSHALKIIINTLGSNPWSIQSWGSSPTLTTNQDYTLTFWAKAETDGTSLKTVMQNTQYAGHTKSLSTEWMPYTWTFRPKEVSPKMKLQFPELDTIWVDDIRLALKPADDGDSDNIPDAWEVGHGLNIATNNTQL
jgi:hypothetical protein